MSEQPIAAAWAGIASSLRSTPRAYEAVAHELLVLILSGHFAVGDRLPSERQLASRFGVSRPTVREALSVLEARGLVVTRKGSGTFVADREGFGEAADGPPDDSPVDFMETRLVLEVAVARLAGKRARANREGLEEVRVSVEALERIADPEALPEELDRDFHRALARLTGNEYLIRLLEPMWETMSQALFITLSRRTWSADHTRRTAAEHRAIYEALSAGDPELAAFAMERHLRGLMATLFEDEAFEGPPPRFFA
jgi:DNA-binding FadR family transcriptional regulator